MEVGLLEEIHRYPVKSMGGELLEGVELGASGLPGDRAWAVRDEVHGGIRGAKKIPALMGLQSRYVSAPVETGSSPAEVILPDGAKVSTSDPDVNERISKAIDHPVTLWPLLPADALDHYRRGAPAHADIEQELRAVFGRTPDEPLPNLALFPPEIMEFESPPGTYFDVFPLMLMTKASLREMQTRVPGSRFDVRRFRPNLVIGDALPKGKGGAPFPEQEWRGRRLQIGDAIIEITVECPRCVMVTHAFEDLPKDPGVMRSLVKEAGGNLGVYARVEKLGLMKVGDPVRLLA
jgi:MOSC domain-containing protein